MDTNKTFSPQPHGGISDVALRLYGNSGAPAVLQLPLTIEEAEARAEVARRIRDEANRRLQLSPLSSPGYYRDGDEGGLILNMATVGSSLH